MDSTARTTRAASRALAVLAVLLGLLAMHGLASTHHAAAATTAAQHHAATADVPSAQDHATGAAVVHDDTGVLAAPGGPVCGDDCLDLSVLCVAVLTAAALALVLARWRSGPRVVAPARAGGPAAVPPARNARAPDPVRELCVSRT